MPGSSQPIQIQTNLEFLAANQFINSDEVWSWGFPPRTICGAVSFRTSSRRDRLEYTLAGDRSFIIDKPLETNILNKTITLDRHSNFAGGNVEVASDVLIGSFYADVKIDEETKFKGANASWNANLLFGSNIGISSKFDETTAFTGGSINLGAKSPLGTLGIKANLDRDTHLTSGTAFWQAQAGSGSINLNADLKQDGNFESKLGLEFPF